MKRVYMSAPWKRVRELRIVIAQYKTRRRRITYSSICRDPVCRFHHSTCRECPFNV